MYKCLTLLSSNKLLPLTSSGLVVDVTLDADELDGELQRLALGVALVQVADLAQLQQRHFSQYFLKMDLSPPLVGFNFSFLIDDRKQEIIRKSMHRSITRYQKKPDTQGE